MKNILLPTDLTISSLYPVHDICKQANGEKCNIYIIHALDMPTGIVDLLFIQERKPYKLISPQFLEALEMLRKKYASSIHLLSFEFVWGNSRLYLRNYMHARQIQSIYLLKDHEYKQPLAQSVNCIPALLKCKVPAVYVEKSQVNDFGTLTMLLYNKEKMHA